MSEAGRLDYTIDRGATLEDVLTWYGDDGQPIDLATSTATLRVSSGSEATPLIEKELSTNSTGAVFLHLTDEETATLPAKPHVYNIQVTSAEGLTTYLVAGRLNILRRL